MEVADDGEWERAAPFVRLVRIPAHPLSVQLAASGHEQLDGGCRAHDAPCFTDGHTCLRYSVAHRFSRTNVRRDISDAGQKSLVPPKARQDRQVHTLVLRKL